VLALKDLLECVRQIAEEVPPVSDLDGIRRAEPCRLGEDRTAAPADHLDAGVRPQPLGQTLGTALRQQVDDGAALQITEQRAIAPALPPRPFVHTEITWRRDVGDRCRRSFQPTEQGVAAGAQPEPLGQPGTRFAAERTGDLPVRGREPVGSSSVAGDGGGQSLREDAV
jgi:hypothetical protein